MSAIDRIASLDPSKQTLQDDLSIKERGFCGKIACSLGKCWDCYKSNTYIVDSKTPSALINSLTQNVSQWIHSGDFDVMYKTNPDKFIKFIQNAQRINEESISRFFYNQEFNDQITNLIEYKKATDSINITIMQACITYGLSDDFDDIELSDTDEQTILTRNE